MSREMPGAGRRAAAWAVHAYTASGVGCGFLALLAVFAHDERTVFLWLAAQVVIDSTDGVLARLARVRDVLPWFSGTRLDDIVDYVTYVFVPATLVVETPIVPPVLAVPVALAMLLSSAFGFSRDDAKTSDHFFTGFPSYWNIVVLYLVAFRLPPLASAGVLLVLAALVFVPIRYLYPSRTVPFMALTLVLGAIWAVLMMGMIWWLDAPPAWVLWPSLVFPVYYIVLSVVLDRRQRRAENGRSRLP